MGCVAWFVGGFQSLVAEDRGVRESVTAVGALGRLEPLGGVVQVAAPYSVQGPSILAELLVGEGQSVTNNQALARTHVHESAQAAWQHALRLLDSAKARLAQSEAGLEPAEIAVLEAERQREEAEWVDARREVERLRKLREQGASTQQALDAAETRIQAQASRMEAANRRLAAGREVRSEDVAVAKAEVVVAEAQAERVRAEWQQSIVRAPAPGRILAVHAQVGEQIGPEGLLDLGQTDRMRVKAEVYETDIRKVRLNQRAEITGESFPGTLIGRVERVGLQVRSNRLLKPDPSEFADSRVVEVIVQLEDSRAVSGLTGALVNVRILP